VGPSARAPRLGLRARAAHARVQLARPARVPDAQAGGARVRRARSRQDLVRSRHRRHGAHRPRAAAARPGPAAIRHIRPVRGGPSPLRPVVSSAAAGRTASAPAEPRARRRYGRGVLAGAQANATLRRTWTLFRAFQVEQTDPDRFYSLLADDSVRQLSSW